MKIPFVFFILLLIFLVDYLTLRYYYILSARKKPRFTRRLITAAVPSLLFILIALVTFTVSRNNIEPHYPFFFYSFAVFVFLYLPRLVFIPFGVTGDLIAWLKFLKARKIILYSGLPVTGLMAGLILYGMIWGRDDTETVYTEVKSKAIPASFNNFTILQISDWHLGSYGTDTAAVARHLRIINSIPADMIVFTGDIVNNYASEALPFTDVFSKLKKAPYGNYAVLGNHDFSDYSQWENEEEKQQNNQQICRFIENAGFHLLRNQAVPVIKNNDTLWLAGVDNWGLPPFMQYGDLAAALNNTGPGHPVILLSHNPTHWSQEVQGNPDIFLTLSGHTHGMQMGIMTKNIRWSPVQYLYPQWAGLYQHQDQYLYVNRGIGFIGFSARVGMRPEITVIKLVKK